MKRDMDLVRDLLFKIEGANDEVAFSDLVSETDSKQYDFAAYHLRMMIEIGLVRGIDAGSNSGDDWLDLQLTWYGHEFLDTMRDPIIWQATKEGMKKVGGGGVDVVMDVAKAYLKMKLKEKLGLDL